MGFAMKTAGVFLPLLKPSRYKGAHGRSWFWQVAHFFAALLVASCVSAPDNKAGEGLRAVCIRETLRDLKESAKLLIEDELQEFGDLRALGS